MLNIAEAQLMQLLGFNVNFLTREDDFTYYEVQAICIMVCPLSSLALAP